MKNMKQWVLMGLLVVSGQTWAAEQAAPKTEKELLSYSIGASIGRNLKSDSTEVDMEVLIKAMKAAMAGDKLAMTDNEIRKVMGDYQAQLRQKNMAARQTATLENKKKGEEFLAQNKTKPGVIELPNGLQYKIIKEGKGRKPAESDMVEVNYSGKLINGKEFDATAPGHPANLKIAALIPGWKQALAMMPVGSKWQLFVPSTLAYGERGVGMDIGPNEVLLFDVELVSIK